MAIWNRNKTATPGQGVPIGVVPAGSPPPGYATWTRGTPPPDDAAGTGGVPPPSVTPPSPSVAQPQAQSQVQPQPQKKKVEEEEEHETPTPRSLEALSGDGKKKKKKKKKRYKLHRVTEEHCNADPYNRRRTRYLSLHGARYNESGSIVSNFPLFAGQEGDIVLKMKLFGHVLYGHYDTGQPLQPKAEFYGARLGPFGRSSDFSMRRCRATAEAIHLLGLHKKLEVMGSNTPAMNKRLWKAFMEENLRAIKTGAPDPFFVNLDGCPDTQDMKRKLLKGQSQAIKDAFERGLRGENAGMRGPGLKAVQGSGARSPGSAVGDDPAPGRVARMGNFFARKAKGLWGGIKKAWKKNPAAAATTAAAGAAQLASAPGPDPGMVPSSSEDKAALRAQAIADRERARAAAQRNTALTVRGPEARDTVPSSTEDKAAIRARVLADLERARAAAQKATALAVRAPVSLQKTGIDVSPVPPPPVEALPPGPDRAATKALPPGPDKPRTRALPPGPNQPKALPPAPSKGMLVAPFAAAVLALVKGLSGPVVSTAPDEARPRLPDSGTTASGPRLLPAAASKGVIDVEGHEVPSDDGYMKVRDDELIFGPPSASAPAKDRKAMVRAEMTHLAASDAFAAFVAAARAPNAEERKEYARVVKIVDAMDGTIRPSDLEFRFREKAGDVIQVMADKGVIVPSGDTPGEWVKAPPGSGKPKPT